LQELLDENPAQMLLKLSKALNVTPKAISKRLHAMRNIHKERIWLPYELSEDAILSIAIFLLSRRRKTFFVAHCDWR